MLVRSWRSALNLLSRRVAALGMAIKARLSGQPASTRRHARIYELFQDLYDLPPAEREKSLERLRKKNEFDYLELRSLLNEVDPPPEPPPKVPTLKPGDTLGRYQILEYIDRGGMSEVYKVSHPELGIRALKILLPEISENAALVEILIREARAAAALNHPYIVIVHDFERQGHLSYMVMEFVEGQSLRKLIGRLSVEEAVKYATQMAKALEFAHSKGIIHRDIKPENIMVRPDGDIKILDFGLARPIRMESAETLIARSGSAGLRSDPHARMGTLRYMAPELFDHKDATPQSDIWSWGIVLYEMLAGRRPFEASTDHEVEEAIRNREPGQPSRFKDLNRVVLKTLRKNPEERYQSMAKAEAELRVPPTPSWTKRTAAGLLITLALSAGYQLYLHMVNPDLRIVGEDKPLTPKEGNAAWPAIAQTKTRMVYAEERNGESILRLVELDKRGAAESNRIIARSFQARFMGPTFAKNDEQKIYFMLQNIAHGTGVLFQMRVPPRQIPAAAESPVHGPVLFEDSGVLLDFSGETNPCQADGTKIESLAWYHRFSGSGRFESICPDGPKEKLAADESMDSPADFSPDGRYFVFFSVDGNTLEESLLIGATEGGDETLITKASSATSYYFPVWSPSGSEILIARRIASDTELLLYHLKNRRLTRSPKRIFLPNLLLRGKPAWLNHGRSVAASVLINGASHAKLLQIFLDDGHNKELSRDEFRDLDSVTCKRYSFDDCEERFIGAKQEDSAIVWTIDLLDGKKTKIASKGRYSGITWRDNDYVISESQYGSNPDLVLLNINQMNSVPSAITNDESREADPVVSPDGRYLVYTSNREEGKGIHLWKIDLRDPHPRPRQLTFGDSSDDHAAISADSQRVLFSSAATGKQLGYQYLWQIKILDGKPERITQDPARNASYSVQDEILCEYLVDDGNGQKKWVIAVLDKNGTLLHIFKNIVIRTRVRWSKDGNSILFVKKQNGVEEIWKQPVHGGPAVKFAPFGEERIFAFALSPDGRRVACVGGAEKSAQIVDMQLAK